MYEELVQRLREEAIQWCANCVYKSEESHICHAPEEPSCDIRDKLQAADAIEELIKVIQNHDFLESLIKPHWIPVTEQKPPLPEDEDVCYVQVIGAVKGKKEAEPVLYSRAYRLRDGKRVRIERFVGDGEVLEVTHWMLMPEPPKEET